jgi:hypothetical protein
MFESAPMKIIRRSAELSIHLSSIISMPLGKDDEFFRPSIEDYISSNTYKVNHMSVLRKELAQHSEYQTLSKQFHCLVSSVMSYNYLGYKIVH